MGVALLRLPNGLDFSELSSEVTLPANGMGHMHTANAHGFTNELMPAANAASELLHIDSNLNLASMDSPNSSFTMPQPAPMPNMQRNSRSYKVTSSDEPAVTYHTKGGSDIPQNLLDAMTIFTRKQPKGTIDVFWLYDDGGGYLVVISHFATNPQVIGNTCRSHNSPALHNLHALPLAELQAKGVRNVPRKRRGAGREEVSL